MVAKSNRKREDINIKLLASEISSDIITQKIKTGNNGKDFEIIVDNPALNETSNDKNQNSNAVRSKVRYQSSGRRVADTASTKQIEEVVILGLGERTKQSLSASVQTVKRQEIVQNNILNALQGKVSGIEVTANSGVPGNAESVVIRGVASITNGKQPLVVIDGTPVDYPNFKINTDNIANVTVLKDAAATALYGSRGSNGVIVINSLTSNYNSKKINLNKRTFYAQETLYNYEDNHLNYARVFSYPVYETPATNYRTDFRETIYWNPIIQTDKNGKAKIDFYNSDANTTFRAIAEGISAKGLLGREEKTYSAQSKLQIDAKIPPYLTQGDEPKIAVVFRNNSNEKKTIEFNKIIPNSIKSGVSDSLIILEPKESGKIILPLQGNKPVNSSIQLIAETDTENERQILPFTIEPKGFRHSYEIATSKDSIISFDIPEYLDKSLMANIKIFRSSASQFLNDIDRLKEKPHGCFEQTSSTTYPNYFILNFLKSKGNINDKDAKKATELLKKGFDRLLTYETKDKGFSLFGSSPPSVTLTAYGLMEFNDLKNVLDVNPALIERTSKFILSRRDGKGNFIINNPSEEKNQYYWSQQGYILYALSEVGMKDEIMKEYSHLYQINQYSDDFYLLALMSNVAFQLDKTKDYQFLVNRMMEKFNKNNVLAETNFMQGRGDDIRKEALALFALSLMKSQKENKDLLTRIINRVNEQNLYSSTQTLVLKLKALTEFYKKFPKIEMSDEPQIFVNNKEVKGNLPLDQFLRIGTNELKIKYPSGIGFPILLSYQFNNLIPEKNPNPELFFITTLDKNKAKIGDNVRMNIKIENLTYKNFGMITAKIGIPAGLTMDPKNLKAMVERNGIAYFEIFDNYLVLYWYNLNYKKNIQINLDTKAEFAGKYTGKANHAFEYYYQQNYQWTNGVEVEISE